MGLGWGAASILFVCKRALNRGLRGWCCSDKRGMFLGEVRYNVDRRGLRAWKAIVLAIGAALGCGRDSPKVIVSPLDGCAPTGSLIVSIDYSPTWSADAASVAYIHSLGAAGVYVVDTLGNAPRQLLQGDVFEPTELSWSPDGTQIAMRYLGNIWTVDVGSAALRQWTDKADVFPHWPGWSPEGRYLTFSIIAKPAGAPESTWGVHLIDTMDGSERALLHDNHATASGSRVAWLPGDVMIVAVPLTESVNGSLKVIHELFTINIDGSGYQRLTAFQGNARGPEWSVGQSLVFFDLIPAPCHNLESRRETWVMRADGSGAHKWAVNLGAPSVTQSFPFSISRVNGRCASVGKDSTGGYGVIVTQNLDGADRKQLTRP